MALRELTKEYLMKAVYQTPLEIVRLMAEALPLGEGTEEARSFFSGQRP